MDDDANRPLKGGSRWKSARSDRGTLRNYSKDVQDRQRKQLEAREKRQQQTRVAAAVATAPMFKEHSPLGGSRSLPSETPVQISLSRKHVDEDSASASADDDATKGIGAGVAFLT